MRRPKDELSADFLLVDLRLPFDAVALADAIIAKCHGNIFAAEGYCEGIGVSPTNKMLNDATKIIKKAAGLIRDGKFDQADGVLGHTSYAVDRVRQ